MERIAPIRSIVRHYRTAEQKGISTFVGFYGCSLDGKCSENPDYKNVLDKRHVCEYTAKELYDEVKEDNIYFIATNGGVTFSGGEQYFDFIKEFRRVCGEAWFLTVETSLNVDLEKIKGLVDVVDNYIVDVKDMNPLIYKSYTRKGNGEVLKNLKWLVSTIGGARIRVRIQILPCSNTDTDVEAVKAIFKELGIEQVVCYQKLQTS